MGSPILGSTDLHIKGKTGARENGRIKQMDLNLYLWDKAKVRDYTYRRTEH
jgi:hypothetical protein